MSASGHPSVAATGMKAILDEISRLGKSIWDLPANRDEDQGLSLGPRRQTEKHAMLALERLQELGRMLSSGEADERNVAGLGFRRFVDTSRPDDPEKLYAYTWELGETLKKDLLSVANNEYLWVALKCELNPNGLEPPSWREHFGAGDLEGLLEGLKTGGSPPAIDPFPPTREIIVRSLTSLYEARSERERLRRTRVAMKGLYLGIVSKILLAVVVTFLCTTVLMIRLSRADDLGGGPMGARCEVLLVALAGALGAMMMHLRQLRDEVTRIREIFSSRYAMLAQPVIGAASAVLLWLILKTGLITVSGKSTAEVGWQLATIFGFLAGFSEPFFIATLGGITRSPGEANPGKKPTPG